MREHAPLVCSVALGVVSDVRASEEIAQDVFLQVWRGLHRLRNPDGFRAWLRQIARNQAHEHLRQRYRHRRVFVDADADAADEAATADEALTAREREQALAEALDALPADSREVLALYYREGNSVRQVADLLELQEATVRKRMSRARQILRDDVLQRLGEDLERSAPGAAFVAAVLAAVAALPAPARASTPRRSEVRVGAVAGLVLGAVIGAALWVTPSPTPAPSAPRPEVPVSLQPRPAPPVAPADVPVPVAPADVPVPADGLPPPETPLQEAMFALAEASGLGIVRCDVRDLEGWQQLTRFQAELRDGVLTMIAWSPGGVEGLNDVDGNPAATVTWEGAHAGQLSTTCKVKPHSPTVERPWAILSLDDVELGDLKDMLADALDRKGDEVHFEEIGVTPIDAALAIPGLSTEARELLEAWRPESAEEAQSRARRYDEMTVDEFRDRFERALTFTDADDENPDP